ncbi:MAG: hypothetical protein UY50_C0027G0007 [Parcubacteria group bacterium GW2011_GWA2_49_9]|nr:MAG: hypothetical protein UY50_C0027G0007 [Parcubacteria group bacterium GW2011_GWA2_49_9]
MSKSHLVIGLVVAAVLVGGVALTRPSGIASNDSSLAASATATLGSDMQPVVVLFNGSGFSPSVVKIVRGRSLEFLNISGTALRIAPLADPKDGSSADLGFAATKSIGKNESFGVSLSQPGIWGYKNLQDPDVVGVVIVE